MFVEAGSYVIAHDLFGKLGIPDWAVPAIRAAPACSGRRHRDRRHGRQ
jgi:hypothetical protein